MFKTIEVDWDNISSLKKEISRLQKRRKLLLRENCNYTKTHFGMSKCNLEDMMGAIQYLDQIPFNLQPGVGEHYVYVHCDPTKRLNVVRDIREYYLATKYKLSHMPIYVGKGIGNRYMNLNRNDSHRKIRSTLLERADDLIAVKIVENLTEEHALFEEQKLIAFLGLRALSNLGMLTNLQTENTVVELFKQSVQSISDQRLKLKIAGLIAHIRTWV